MDERDITSAWQPLSDKSPRADPPGEAAEPVDIFARPTERSEVISFEDWRGLSGVEELTARRAWALAEEWLHKAQRHPRLEELRWALIEQAKPTTAETLRQRGYTLR